MAKDEKKKTSMGMDENVEALISYLGSVVTGFIFFLGEKNSKFVRFHALQSIFVGSLFISAMILLSIIFAIIGAIAYNASAAWGVITLIGGLLNLLLWLGWVATTIICIIKAYQMEGFKLPIIGDIAEKQIAK